MRRIGDLEALRSELKAKGLPVLQDAAARVFLGGHPGDAYVWTMDSNPKTFAFFLTTADSPSASVQLKATLTKVSAP
jgi:hypothetical protein